MLLSVVHDWLKYLAMGKKRNSLYGNVNVSYIYYYLRILQIKV